MSGRRIALIGGAGFIGHNLALELRTRGADVLVVDGLHVNNLLSIASGDSINRQLYVKMIHQRLELMHGAGVQLQPQDARDYHALSRILNAFKPTVIVQLAAVAHATRSNKDPYSTFDHSLRTLENALDWARDGVEQFIFFSSSMVYGNFQTPVVDENHPLDPIGIYGALKLAGEKMVIAYQQVFQLPYTILRPSALYGPRCVSRRVAQIFIENALEGRPLVVDGDGLELVDFTYIDDLVDGVCLAIGNPNAINQVFNMTAGDARSIRALIDQVRREFPAVEVNYIERDSLRPFRGTLSVEKAHRLIGYHPANPVEVGIPKYVDWYRSQIGVPSSAR